MGAIGAAMGAEAIGAAAIGGAAMGALIGAIGAALG